MLCCEAERLERERDVIFYHFRSHITSFFLQASTPITGINGSKPSVLRDRNQFAACSHSGEAVHVDRCVAGAAEESMTFPITLSA